MSGDDPEMLCDWCLTYPDSLFTGLVSVPFPPAPAAVAVAVDDCCNDARVDYLLCEQHWTMLRDQPLPGTCPHCGSVADTLDAIVHTAMPLGVDLDDILTRRDPVTEPVSAGRMSAHATLPNAIRLSEVTVGDEPAPTAWPVDNYDYVAMIEQAWGGRRQRAINDAHAKASAHIADVVAQRATANAAHDATTTAQLDTTIATMTYQRDHTVRAATDALKHDKHAFAMWRQTDDGRYYVDWVQRTCTMTTWIFQTDAEWYEAWDRAVATISDDERAAHARKQWITRPRRHHIMRWARDIAVAVALIGVVAAIAISPLWWALAAAATTAAGYAVVTGRDTDWATANDTAGRTAHKARVARFGFDPLDEPDRHPPRWATTHATVYAADMQQIALAAFEAPPTPQSLPEPVWPTLTRAQDIPVAEQRAVLATLTTPYS